MKCVQQGRTIKAKGVKKSGKFIWANYSFIFVDLVNVMVRSGEDIRRFLCSRFLNLFLAVSIYNLCLIGTCYGEFLYDMNETTLTLCTRAPYNELTVFVGTSAFTEKFFNKHLNVFAIITVASTALIKSGTPYSLC